MVRKGLTVAILAFVGALMLFGCDATNIAAGEGGGAVGVTQPNVPQASGGNAYGTTGDSQVSGPSSDTEVGSAR